MTNLWNRISNALGLEEAESAPDEQRTAEFAACALLLEMTEADLNVEPSERAAVKAALKTTFALDDDTVNALVRRTHEGLNRDVSYHPHVETINELLGPAEKEQIVEQLWRVAFADGELDRYEEHYLRKLCDLIFVPHKIFLQTKHRVEESLGQ